MKQNFTLESYRTIAPPGVIDLAFRLSEQMKGRSILHVNSTRFGGGVAEMLHRLVPMFNGFGVSASWEVMEGTPFFYKTTKSFHNALQGAGQSITADMYDEFLMVNKKNAKKISFDADVVIIHDPQPLACVQKKLKKAFWLWRCHIDISNPQRRVWSFLRNYVMKYSGAIFSLPSFSQRLAIPQYLVYPSIDPLSDKNKDLEQSQIEGVLRQYNIPNDKPIILQVSRFDTFKDPLGVIAAYKLAKKYNDCCLVLAGGAAADDPEGIEVLAKIKDRAGEDKDIFVLDLPPDANIQINALQRAAVVILQK